RESDLSTGFGSMNRRETSRSERPLPEVSWTAGKANWPGTGLTWFSRMTVFLRDVGESRDRACAIRCPAFDIAPDASVTFTGRPVRLHGLVLKRTYQRKVSRRKRRHGLRHRMQTRAGRAVLSARRRKGRKRLAA